VIGLGRVQQQQRVIGRRRIDDDELSSPCATVSAKARKTAISSVHGERRFSSSSARPCASSPWPAVASTSSV
jgi:hypothetical protein